MPCPADPSLLRGLYTRALYGLAGLVFASLVACTRTEVVEQPIDDELLNAKVLDIIRQNPQVMIDAITAQQVANQQAAEREREKTLRARIDALDLAALREGSPVQGDPRGQLVLVEFSDFECPFCARAQTTLRAFAARHGTEVTRVFKHLPLPSLHPHAVSAARAAWAAQQQGKFWEYHARLFEQQQTLGDASYVQMARDLGLDLDRFERDRRGDAAGAALDRDLAFARQLGLEGTPFFLINREPVNGAQPLEVFEAALEKARAVRPTGP